MKESTLPNKCEICGLNFSVKFRDNEQAERYNSFFVQLRKLEELNLIPKAFRGRNIILGIENYGGTSFCAVNHKSWSDKTKPCPEWQPNYELSKADSLAIHFAKKTHTLTRKVFFLTLIMVIQLISILPILSEYMKKLSVFIISIF
jgi:hypothetical protein